jgi:urocanate hydratase
MGGAQPLAGVLAGACVLASNASSPHRLPPHPLCGQAGHHLDDALAMIAKHTGRRGHLHRPAGQRGRNPARAGAAAAPRPDIVTDQTSAHDLINGYLPVGWTVEQWKPPRPTRPSTPT